ncbi:MAG: glycosyltransferase family 4 protein [Candidatus Woesearchaeota archaeon]
MVRVLMFGWEFAPMYSGGLGVACAGLTKGLVKKGVDVTFVVPKKPDGVKSHVRLLSAEEFAKGIKFKTISSPLSPYMSNEQYLRMFKGNPFLARLYGPNLFEEVERYARAAQSIAAMEKFDIIHSHDWMTYKAGINAKRITKKPLVVHIHATEFDRTGGIGINPKIYDIEYEGFHAADKICAVSNYTKQTLVEKYGVSNEKIEVVHNGVELEEGEDEEFALKSTDKIVLFLGRLTIQKGPDWFVEAAKKVLEVMPNVKFVIAGSGDMEGTLINKVIELGIADKVLFTGFLKGKDINRAYKMADVYVLSSVSEPFGITPLEAMLNGTPTIVSKQSGVAEVIKHCLKVDFWDTNEMANKIISILNQTALKEVLSKEGKAEASKLGWDGPAEKVFKVYKELLKK